MGLLDSRAYAWHSRWGLRLVMAACLWVACTAGRAALAGAQFAEVSQQVAAHPEDLSAGNRLRRICREQRIYDQCIEFFAALVKAHPHTAAVRYNAALANIDNLPGHSLLAQARLSTSSIEHASAVLERSPDDWLALYIRGLNQLYWPTWYRRTGRAVTDLTRCVSISEGLPAEQRRQYMALAHAALGDAYVKLEKFAEARQVWERGALLHPSAVLTQRLQIPLASLGEAISELRSREVPVDTDIEFYAPSPT